MISVIIPAQNDAQSLQRTISHVFENAAYKRLLQEVIVVDGGCRAESIAEAKRLGARVIRSVMKSRGALLNCGARHAKGKVLYFLPPNSLPPRNFVSAIVKASTKGFTSGTFSLQFDYKHWLLNSLSWVSKRFNNWIISDQSLFVSKDLFDKSGGFREDHLVMANQEFIARLKRYSNFIVLKDSITSSARKYVRYGFFRTGLLQAIVYMLHKAGYSQHSMAGLYRKYLRWDIGPKAKAKKIQPVTVTESVHVATLQQ